jgi:hypothetical protein
MLTTEAALRAYAAMVNTLDVSRLEPLLADDFHYASQWVFAEIESKQEYLDYIAGKFSLKRCNSKVWAEIGELEQSFSHGAGSPCVYIAQDDKNRIVSVVLTSVKNNKISRIDMCIPELYRGKRLGIYPADDPVG